MEQTVSELFEVLRTPVYRHLLLLLRNPQEAEDLTQEAFLRLFVQLKKGEPVKEPRAWIFQVARNLALDQLRRRDAAASPQGTAEGHCVELVDREPSAEQRMIEGEKRARMEKALRALSIQERACLDLRAEGLKYREIADALSVRISTVESALGRAITKLFQRTHG